MNSSIKNIIAFAFLFLLSFLDQTNAQPSPADRGTDPGGGPNGPPLGAPIDDFVWGLIALSIIYMGYKWYQIKNHSSSISN